jgi:hypothetical protein
MRVAICDIGRIRNDGIESLPRDRIEPVTTAFRLVTSATLGVAGSHCERLSRKVDRHDPRVREQLQVMTAMQPLPVPNSRIFQERLGMHSITVPPAAQSLVAG